ncbi:MAG: restriction endonuclease subunit S [Ligilactobacillus salivarius]|nr:restriction endonuclease subunit S [Ligilactobacillus salivarius]
MNKKEVKRAPVLRFKGFTNDWEQRKLGEIAKTYSGGTPSISNKKFYINGHIPFIKSGEIGSTRTEQKINYDGLNNSSARLIETGTLLYALYGATSGKAAISPIDGAINQAVLAIIPQNNVNRFIYEWLNKNKSRITGKYLQGGQGNLSAKIIKQINIYITSKNEELKISNILRIVNKIISLQQRKLKLLKAIKFYLLNQFLLNNNKWPKKKFGNLVNINRGLTYHPFDVVNSDGIRVLRSSNIKDSRISFNKDDVFVRTSIVKEKYQLKKNDILVTAANGSSNLIGKHALMTKNIPNQVGGFMFSIETNEPYFIFACLESNWFKKLIHKSTTGGNGALGNLKGKDIKNAWIHIPEREIRERIGELEKNIDNFIDYNQKIVNKLIKFKQFLLQNMFI